MSSPAIPEHLKKYQQKQTEEASSLADSGNPTVPRLSIKGGKFRYVLGEDESKKFSSVDVVIVGVDPQGGRMNKAFYEGAYDPSNPSPPDCSSINGVVPDSWVAEPQASVCARCPQNAFGSAVNAQGQRTKGKACKDSKWLWCIKLEDVDTESPDVWCLSVPASSLKALSAYGRQVNKTGLPLHVIHTKIELDDEYDYPVLDIQLAGYLNEQQSAIADETHEAQPWRDLVGDTGVPQEALTRRTEDQGLVEHTPAADAAALDEAEEPPKKQAKKSETIDAAPQKADIDNPDAAVESW